MAARTEAELMAARDLLDAIDQTMGAGQRLMDTLRDSVENEPLANAASICRWELLVLRERIAELGGAGAPRPAQAETIRAVDGAAAAAHVLGNGYRFHNLDRICQGGEALAAHLHALEQTRARLAATVGPLPASATTPVSESARAS